MTLGCLSGASVIAAIQTHHWFALPFAGLFMFGYLFVATRLIGEQLHARRDSVVPVENRGMDVEPSAIARTA